MSGGVGISKTILLVVTFLVFALIPNVGIAAQIFVEPGNSIQTSVNNAHPGDVIVLKPGTYVESIKINKGNITIKSESGNPEDTIVQARSQSSNGFSLTGKNIEIRGLKITGAGRPGYSGINLSSCTNCKIENNKLVNNSRGICLFNSRWNLISKNTAINSGTYGIALASAMNNTISGNSVYDNIRGLYLGSSDDNIVSGNRVWNNSIFGLFVCGRSERNTVYNNYFNDTNLTVKNGIGNAYSTTKTQGPNIMGGPYIGGNFWGSPNGTGFSQTAIDANKDGFSDYIYKSISGSRYSDNLPLINPNTPGPILPDANFSSDPISGNSPLNVTFFDTSTGDPTGWNWSFGDGASSLEQNPEHTYFSGGNYKITLTVSNTAGSNKIVKSDYIHVIGPVLPKPEVSFWGSKTAGTAPLTIYFTDKSTNNPTSWLWNFGDGTTSNLQNPKHTYLTAGNYTVTLFASNTVGTGTKIRSDYIKVSQAPVASFWGSKTSGTVPLTVYFTDNSKNSPASWDWNFGDGATSKLQNPTHTYSEPGNYTVTLSAKNEAGTGTKVRPDYIQVTRSLKVPAASFWGSKVSGYAPLTVYFTDNSTNLPTSWEWNLGDGTISNLQNPKHTYLTAGNYTVTLTATNAYGAGTKIRTDYIKVMKN